MVCKEDFILWFKSLESYKRIDVMYELVSACIPFEIRIVGSFIEEFGKMSFQELHGSALIANDLDRLTKDSTLLQGLIEEGVRHRAIIYLSLLSGTNWKCANWIYKTLLRTEWVETCLLQKGVKDGVLLSELLLLFTIGMRHPALTFEQKMFCGDLVEQLSKQKNSETGVSISKDGVGNGGKLSNCEDGKISQHETFNNVNGPCDMYRNMRNRPGFAGTISGAPEVPPFPPPPISPLVSQPSSPSRSRATSPYKTGGRLAPQPTPSGNTANLSVTSNVPLYSEMKLKDDELNHIADDKLRDSWHNTSGHHDVKPPNGIRASHYSKVPKQYIREQLQALNLVGANSLHCSSSSSSCDNSSNHSPPDTPSVTPAIPHHGPGRGDKISRTNGVPIVKLGPSVCDTNAPPPPLNNCSVPYTSFPPPPVPLAVVPPPARSVYPYNDTYRMPPFNAQYHYQHPEMYTYNNYSYVPYVFSSTHSQVPPRSSHCFNCGATGHNGSECKGQTIEDITQKKAYALDYNLTLPDADK